MSDLIYRQQNFVPDYFVDKFGRCDVTHAVVALTAATSGQSIVPLDANRDILVIQLHLSANADTDVIFTASGAACSGIYYLGTAAPRVRNIFLGPDALGIIKVPAGSALLANCGANAAHVYARYLYYYPGK